MTLRHPNPNSSPNQGFGPAARREPGIERERGMAKKLGPTVHVGSAHFNGTDVIIKQTGEAFSKAFYRVMIIDVAANVQEYDVQSPDMFEFIAERIKADMVQRELDEKENQKRWGGADGQADSVQGVGDP